MPSKSKKQRHLVAAVAHDPQFAKKVGIPQQVGKEFMKADMGEEPKKKGQSHHGRIMYPKR